MNSLFELNNYANTPVEIQDNRFATVITTNLTNNFNNEITINSTTYTGVPRTYDIVEIINYSIAACEVKFSIISDIADPLTGSTLSWTNLPSGVSPTISGQTYTFSDVDTITIWDVIKSPSWILPANFATKTKWFLQVDISWYDEEQFTRRTLTYYVYDPRYYFTARIFTESNIEIVNTKIIQFDIAASNAVILNVYPDAAIEAEFTLTCEFDVVDLYLLGSQASLSCILSYNPALGSSTMASTTTTVVPTLTEYIAIVNMESRNYRSNVENAIFSSSTPQIIDPNPNQIISFTLSTTTNNGQWGTSSSQTASNSFTFTGTVTAANQAFASMKFWPDLNVTSTITFRYQQYLDDILVKDKTLTLTHIGAGTIPVRQYEFNSSNSWITRYEERKYCKMSWLMIGGGGGGAGSSDWDIDGGFNWLAGGGGGAAALPNYAIDELVTGTNYAITIGQGGDGGSAGSSGINGTSTIFNGFTSAGGSAGTTHTGTVPKRNGGSNASYLGGFGPQIGDTPPYKGGGGAGSASAGGNAIGTYRTGSGGRGGNETYIALKTIGFITYAKTVGGGGSGGGGIIPTNFSSAGSGGQGAVPTVGSPPPQLSGNPGYDGLVYIITYFGY